MTVIRITGHQHYPSAAVLFHCASWMSQSPARNISSKILLCDITHGDIQSLYESLCTNTGIDDSEPLMHGAYALIQPSKDDPLLDIGDTYSIVNRFCNAIVIATGHALTWTRVIVSRDAFKTSCGTWTIHPEGTQTSFLRPQGPEFTDECLDLISNIWPTMETMWIRGKATGRFNNALAFFYYAWRSDYIDQACLNLAVCIEGLFAPHTQTETTHQICFNIAKYSGTSPQDQERIFTLFRDFYRVRSSVVHGGIANEEKLIEYTCKAFLHMASVLRKITTDLKQAECFASEELRKTMFREFLFR